MAKIHFILHARRSRNDAYKSFVAATIAEHILQRRQAPFCIDTDLARPTFSGYKKLAPTTLSIMENGKVDDAGFQRLIQVIGKSSVDVVIDCPEVSFLSVSRYLGMHRITEKFEQLGHRVIVHVVAVGGYDLRSKVYQTFPLSLQVPCKAGFIVWMKKNPNLFRPESAYDAPLYGEKRKNAAAVVNVPSVEEEGCGFDLTNMMRQKHTFAEALKPNILFDMDRPRVRYLKNHLFTQLDRIAIL